MCQLLVITIWLLMRSCMTCGELVVKNSGIHHIDRQDVGMVFYVEIKNEGKQCFAISVRMIKCCETICPSDVECEHMQLVGGDMGILSPNVIRNLTLVWPTLISAFDPFFEQCGNHDYSQRKNLGHFIIQYLHDRVGDCMIAIGYTTRDNQTGELHQKVKFDTSVSSHNVKPILQGYYTTGDTRKCSTVDLDTLDDCRPVNCHIKYNGKRNFFNRRQSRCQAVPICIADTTKELPDVAYVPASNTCRDLENAVNEVEVRALSQGIAEAAWRSESLPYLSNIYCHHGTTDNATGFCVCYDGWTSKPVDNLEPSTERIHLCNVRMLFWPRLAVGGIKTVITIIAALLGVLVVLFCCAMAYVMRFNRHPNPAEDISACGTQTVPSNSCVPSTTRSRSCDTSCSSTTDRPTTSYKRINVHRNPENKNVESETSVNSFNATINHLKLSEY